MLLHSSQPLVSLSRLDSVIFANSHLSRLATYIGKHGESVVSFVLSNFSRPLIDITGGTAGSDGTQMPWKR